MKDLRSASPSESCDGDELPGARDRSEGEEAELDAVLREMADLIQQPASLAGDARLSAERDFLGNRQMAPWERVDIYRQQYWLRHEDSLTEDFPATCRLLGPAWPNVARGYLAACPPVTPSLRELGFALPEYLAGVDQRELEGASSKGLDLALDMARLEVAYLEVFDAPDELPLDATRLAAIGPADWPLVRLRLSGALRLLESCYPVADLRRTLRASEDPETASSAIDRACSGVRSEATCLAVYRREHALFDCELDPIAFEILRRLGSGSRLAEACDGAARQLPGRAGALDTQLADWFAVWTRRGWIAEVLPAEQGVGADRLSGIGA